jgi:hypothetical protein
MVLAYTTIVRPIQLDLQQVDGWRLAFLSETIAALRDVICSRGSTTRPARNEPLPLHCHSRPSSDKIDEYKTYRIAQSSSTKPVSHTFPETVGEDGDGWNDVTVAELEKQIQLNLEEQEKSSSASPPCAPCPHRLLNHRRMILIAELRAESLIKDRKSDEMLLDSTPRL